MTIQKTTRNKKARKYRRNGYEGNDDAGNDEVRMIRVVVVHNAVSAVVRIVVLSRVDVTEEDTVVDVVGIGSVTIAVERSELVSVMLDEVVLSALVVVRISVVVVIVFTVAGEVSELVGTVNPKVDDVVGGTSDVTVVICSLFVDSKTVVAVRDFELFAVGRVASISDDEFRHSSGRVLFNMPHSNE